MCVGITWKLIKRLRFIEGPKTLFLPSAPSDSNTMEFWETKKCLHCVSSVTAKREMIIERNPTFPCFAFVLQISAFFWNIYIQINIKKKSGDSRSWSFQDSLVLSCICTGFFLHGTLSLASLSSPTPSTPGLCPPQAYLWSLPSHPTLLFTCPDLEV